MIGPLFSVIWLLKTTNTESPQPKIVCFVKPLARTSNPRSPIKLLLMSKTFKKKFRCKKRPKQSASFVYNPVEGRYNSQRVVLVIRLSTKKYSNEWYV